MNNQLTSNYFTVKNGVRQGDPLSPYLFILIVEILSINIRENKNIYGLNIQNKELKLVQYADDTTIILKDINSAKIVFEVLQQFYKCSGLKVNVD